MRDDIGNAIRSGDVATLTQLVAADPTLAHARLDGERTLLHIATDWPGHFPNVRETISELIARGADMNARFQGGGHSETPLHWAASSDDLNALNTLLEHGADLEAPGAVIGGGTPLADAVAFGQWRAARKLVERGAHSTMWQAAALGLVDRVQECLSSDPAPSQADVTNAFWCACHGGQLEAADLLLGRGADFNWVGYDGFTPFDAAVRNGNREVIDWLTGRGAIQAKGIE